MALAAGVSVNTGVLVEAGVLLATGKTTATVVAVGAATGEA